MLVLRALPCLQTELESSSVVSESRTRGGDRQEDPDYTLIVRVEDLAGASENALSGITSVKVVVEQNLWVNPGPLTVREHLKAQYPMVIAKVGAGGRWLGGCWLGGRGGGWVGSWLVGGWAGVEILFGLYPICFLFSALVR